MEGSATKKVKHFFLKSHRISLSCPSRCARRLCRHPLCERTRTGHVSPRFVKKKNTVDEKIEEEKNQTIKKIIYESIDIPL